MRPGCRAEEFSFKFGSIQQWRMSYLMGVVFSVEPLNDLFNPRLAMLVSLFSSDVCLPPTVPKNNESKNGRTGIIIWRLRRWFQQRAEVTNGEVEDGRGGALLRADG
jgi:hypothetical protein